MPSATPSGVGMDADRDPGVSLRSTPGYCLASLRLGAGKFRPV